MPSTSRWTNYAELSVLFFLHGMALGMWWVPLTTVLDAHGLRAIRPYAFATSALAALVSPLIFGALADRQVGSVRVLRWIAFSGTALTALASTAIELQWQPWLVLVLIQLVSLFLAPSWSISTTIVLERLHEARRQFGPLRAMGTLGWMAGCWIVSALHADSSTLAGYSAAVMWLALAAFTYLFPSVTPPTAPERLTLRQRLGLDALGVLNHHDHRVVFVTAALVTIPLAAFYPFTPPHLRALGLEQTSAWMTLGQVTEIAALLGLSTLLSRCRLRSIFLCGLGFALLRYVLCVGDTKAWVLAGVSLHGLAFTLFFVTVPIYLNERVEPAWRARAQALFTLMTSGVGNLLGYLGTGWWFAWCERPDGMRWPQFWGGLAVAVAAVGLYFRIAYHGRSGQAAEPRAR